MMYAFDVAAGRERFVLTENRCHIYIYISIEELLIGVTFAFRTSQESVSCWCDGIERRLLRQHFDHHSNEELGACVCVLCVHALHTAAAPPPPPVLVVRSWSCFINAVVYMICVLGTNGTY